MNNNQQQESLSLRDLWEIFMDNIWLFVISTSLALGVAVIYIVVTPPKYERSASILIKDDESGAATQGLGMQGFDDLGLFKTNTNINNEINILQTVAFMREVVGRLGLEYNYRERYKRVRWVDLYHNTPFVVVCDTTLRRSTFGFQLTILDGDRFEISEFCDGRDEQIMADVVSQFGETLPTPMGEITITKSQPFWIDGEMEGRMYRFSKESSVQVAKDILKRLSVALRSEDASIVDIVVVDEHPLRAESILNTLISVYNENWIKDRNEIAFNTSGFIDERLSVIETELDSVDDNIAEFKSRERIPDIAAVANLQLEESSHNKQEQLAIKNQLSMARYIQDCISSTTYANQLLPVNIGIDNRGVETLIEEYNALLLLKSSLQANSGENNPLVVEMSAKLQAIRSAINLSIKEHISTLTIQLDNLSLSERNNTQRLSSTPRQAKELLSVERQQMIKEQLFLYLLQKREENELSQAFSAYNTKILSGADGSPSPKEPRRLIVLLVALIVGFVVPILYLIIKESLDTFVRSNRDLEWLGIPIIGSLPHNAAQKKGDYLSGMTPHTEDRSISSESFRVLRSNLDFMSPQERDGAQVIQIVSLLPGSGKSYVSANLALSVALRESKVLLIDCDIRKSTLSDYLNVSYFGISDYLCGRKSGKEVVVKSPFNENLDIIPAGKIAPNPSELLSKPKFRELLKQMRGRYDYIFIDCPPVDIVTDSAVIAAYCDTTIFVIRAEKFDKRLLPEVKAVYDGGKYNNMCLLLNGVSNKGKGYYGYRKYGYYGGGYGEYVKGDR